MFDKYSMRKKTIVRSTQTNMNMLDDSERKITYRSKVRYAMPVYFAKNSRTQWYKCSEILVSLALDTRAFNNVH